MQLHTRAVFATSDYFLGSSFMRYSISFLALGLALVSGMAVAADPVKPAATAPAAVVPKSAAPAPSTAAAPAAPAAADTTAADKTPQQSKMATCNKNAEGKKGDERKAFMKECLGAGKPATQQSKMKTCNAEATGKKGDERKAFMSECLKK
jgi:hypothetical protein